MDWRLGRGDGGGGFWVDFVAECVYPPRRVTVVRDRCSAGGGGGEVVFPGSGTSSGWGSAGSLRVSVKGVVVVAVRVALDLL
jgi:hypothetical protein